MTVVVAGRVVMDRAADLSGCLVAFGDPDALVIHAHAQTGADGRFRLALEDGTTGGVLIAGADLPEVIGVAAEAVSAPGMAIHRLGLPSPVPLTVRVAGLAPARLRLEIELAAHRLDGIPDRWLDLLSLPIDARAETRASVRPASEGEALFAVQRGRWIVSANGPGVRVVGARSGGEQLEGDWRGYGVDVSGSTEVELLIETGEYEPRTA